MSAIETFKTKLDAAQARMAELKAQMFKETDEAFNGLFKEFFDAYPEVRTIHWTQATPYFNDGDPCVFHLGEVYFSSQEHEEVEPDDEDNSIETNQWDDASRKTVPIPGKEALDAAMKSLSELINDMEDYLLQRFEDHKHIKVHRGGVEVGDYDHD